MTPAKWILAGISALAAALYSILGLPFYIGRFIDDALYVCMSMSLLNGHYRAAFSPFYEPITNHLPGYSLLLAPLVQVFGPLSPALKLFSILMAVASVLLVALLMKRAGFGKKTQLIAAALVAFNPIFANYAGTVMPEPSFIFFSLLILLTLDSPKQSMVYGAGILLGFACLIRPQGILLLLTIVGIYFLQKEWKRASLFLLCGLLFPLLVTGRNYATSGTPTEYFNLIAASWETLSQPAIYLGRLKTNLGMMFPNAFFQIPMIDNLILKKLLGWTAVLTCLGLLIRALKRMPFSWAIQGGICYCLISLLILPFWFTTDTRYFLILLPFVVMGVLAGLHELVSVRPFLKKIFVPLLSLLLIFYGAIDVARFKTLWPLKGTTDAGLPKETYGWISTHLPAPALLLSVSPAAVYLYTRHKGVSFFVHNNEEDFVHLLKESKVAYVLIDSAPRVQLTNNSAQVTSEEKIKTWIQDESKFQLIYENKREGIKIFHLLD